MANFTFNAAQVSPSDSFDPIPEGWYIAKVVKSELKATKDGTGKYINMSFEVIEGNFKKRMVFAMFNIENRNAVAVDIAYKQLSALCHAAGVMQIQDTVQLHEIPVAIKVGIRGGEAKAGGGTYEPTNEIKGYKAAGNVSTSPAAQAPAWNQAPTQAPAAAWNQAPQAPAQAPAQFAAPAQQAPAAAQANWTPQAEAPAVNPASNAATEQPPQAANAGDVPPWAQ